MNFKKIQVNKIYNYIIVGYCFLISASVIFSCKTNAAFSNDYENVIQDIKKIYAPDARVTLFDIKTENKNGKLIVKGETSNLEAKKILLDNLGKKNIEIKDEIKVLPDSEDNFNDFGIVRLSVCNIRTKPQHSAELATQAILGTPVKILKKSDDWLMIQTPDHYIGWVDNAGIKSMNEIERENWMGSRKIVSVNRGGYVRETEDKNSNIISDLVLGSILVNKGHSSDNLHWIAEFPDGRHGYVEKVDFMELQDFLEFSKKTDNHDIIITALQLLGAPYMWGGTSEKAMDCSGFTKTVFFRNGYIIPRDASQQVLVGDKVKLDENLSDLQSGDLIFFGNLRDDKTERITHVAIYLGNGKIIHAAGEVKIQSLKKGDPDFSEARFKSMLQARRYITSRSNDDLKRIYEDFSYFK